MRVVQKNGLVSVSIHSWNFQEQGPRVAEELCKIATGIREFPLPHLLCAPASRKPVLYFPLYHPLFIHFAEEDPRRAYVIYGAAGSRRGVRVVAHRPESHAVYVLSEAGNPFKGKGSLTFLPQEVDFFRRYGQSYFRENGFYASGSPSLLEILLPPTWEQPDFDIADAIGKHIEQQENCLAKILSMKGE